MTSTRPRLQQKRSLLLAPQIAQSIRLLQMTAVELEGFINTELEKNPLLEKSENAENLYNAQPAANSPIRAEHSSRGETVDPALLVAARPSLQDYLYEQIIFAFRNDTERAIAMDLSWQVDGAGYFTGNPEDTARQFHTSLSRVQTVFSHMQAFEPAGIFARSLSECLALQLKRQGRFTAAMERLLQNLPLLARHDYAALARLCKTGTDDIITMRKEICRLAPKPAANWTTDIIEAITPDAFVAEDENGAFHATLNTAALPSVFINHTYAPDRCANQTERDFFTNCQNHANWLLHALEQRAQTLLKVIGEIINHQEAFLRHGPMAIKPLKRAAIAESINMHESTVSRVVAHKYVATPRGIFALHHFFSGGLSGNNTPHNHATDAVQARIRQMIAAEPADNILSDDIIVQRLQADGIDIARRTVAKYRKAMHIPSAFIQQRLRKYGKQ